MGADWPKPTTATAREQLRKRRRERLRPHWPAIRQRLNDLEARILDLRIGLSTDVGCTQETIARRLHVSQQTVVALERRALDHAIDVLAGR